MRAPTLIFLATIAGVPLGQAAWELARSERVQALDAFGPLREERLRRFEDELRRASFVQQVVVPWAQWSLTRFLRRGNEKALVGEDGWLFFSEDVDLATGPSVMTAGGGPRALETLTRLRERLAERGVELLALPVPTKAQVETAAFAGPGAAERALGAAGVADFLAALERCGIPFLDLRPLIAERPPGASYLRRDTHWRPELVRAVAGELARRVEAAAGWERSGAALYREQPAVVGGRGDTRDLLSLPAGAELYAPESLALRRVVAAGSGADWEPDPRAEVLLLGDSFTRVFSDPRLEMGTGAGLAEQLALALQRPVDRIAMAGGGPDGARAALARREAGLGRARVLVWEFTLRDLARPDGWRWIDLPEPSARSAAQAGDATVLAEVVEVSRVDPEFDYAFCLGIVEYAVLEGPPGAGARIWVAYPVLVDYEPTPEAGFSVGERHRLRLGPLEEHYDLEETAWVDDTDAGRTIYWAESREPADG